jgi:murein DD-endopeptidase MepM/ murein hydrolase activator NlpD
VARKFYTIMIIPHARARFRNIRLSRDVVIVAAGVLVFLVLSALLLPRYLVMSTLQASSLERLEAENRTLRTTNEQYDQDLNALRTRLADFEQKASKLALMAGVDSLPSGNLPAGSSGDLPDGYDPNSLRPDYLDEEISILKGRAEALDRSFDVLDQAYAEVAVRLATTPSISPTLGIVGSGFAYRRDPFTGEREFHTGVDIVANAGTPVLATADGVVVEAGRLSSYGKAVFLSHGNGLGSRYGHLSEILVRPGQRVHRGDRIGSVGATGRATGYHLHYEVLRNDRKVDPMPYILDNDPPS